MNKLVGELKEINLIEGSLIPTNLEQLSGELISLEVPYFNGELTIPKEVPTPSYQGEYIITPKPFNNEVLRTNGFTMTDDVTVLKIPYYETSNESSGYTVYIGGE